MLWHDGQVHNLLDTEIGKWRKDTFIAGSQKVKGLDCVSFRENYEVGSR